MPDDYIMPVRQWDKPPPAPHPAPEVKCRPAVDAEIPTGARRVLTLARAHGWATFVTYARGTVPGSRPLRVADSVVLRMSGQGGQAWAAWLDGKFDTGQIWHRAGPYSAKLAAIREHIQTSGQLCPARQREDDDD